MITTQEIYAHLNTMTKDELLQLNNAVVHEVKWKRKQETADKKKTLKVGMRVWWDGKKGFNTGMITDIRITKADVIADEGTRYECPIAMLNELVINVTVKKTPEFNTATGEFE
tara:strand:+ start:1183 stop:1521 length:339 start_codon:yes stop_codon:yes gene_type:complete